MTGFAPAAAGRIRERIEQRLAGHARMREEAGLPAEAAAQRQAVVERLLDGELDEYAASELAAGRAAPAPDAEQRLRGQLLDSLLGLGPLERLLADDQVENVFANGSQRVFVRYADGRKEAGPALAASDDALIELVRQLVTRAGVEERRFDRGRPSLNLQLPDGSRLFAAMAVTGAVSLSIRRHRFRTAALRDLSQRGMCDRPVAALLAGLVRARKNILVAGGTNVGKTTLLRALAAEVPPHERLITIEDTLELGLDADPVAHPDVVAMQAREPNIEGQGEIDQAELVRWALRMAPDRVIVGEIRGPEVVPMCNAMSQGNDGSMSTVHASTSQGVFTKLASYAAQAARPLGLEATNLLVGSAVDVVVHLGWDHHKRRVVDSVRQITGTDGPQIVSNEVYRPGPDGRAVAATAPLAQTVEEIAAAEGTDVPALLAPWTSRSVLPDPRGLMV